MTIRQHSKKKILRGFLSSFGGTGFSRILGAARDLTISHFFGASRLTDIFWISFTIPNVFRRFVADEGLTGAMIPAISEAEKEKGTEAARNLTDATFTFLVLTNLLLIILGIVFAPAIVTMFGAGFRSNPVNFQLAVRVTRFLFPFVFFVSLVSYSEGILNYRGHFFIPKIAPGIVSLGIVLSIFFLFNKISQPLNSLIIGVLFGGLFHFLINIPLLIKKWFFPRISFDFKNAIFTKFLKEMGKVVLIGFFAQINIMILRTLSSLLEVGSVTWFWNANRLIDLAQGTIAIAMGSAILPMISKSAANKDWEKFETDFNYSFTVTAFFIIPAGAILLSFAFPTVSILFRHGSYTIKDCQITSSVLQWMIPFMWSVAAINLVKKVFFAINDRTSLLYVGGAGTILTFAIGFVLMRYYAITGIAIALSFSTIFQLIAYFIILKKKFSRKVSFFSIIAPLLKMLAATIIALPATLLIKQYGTWEKGFNLSNIIILFSSIGLFAFIYLLITYLFKLNIIFKRSINNRKAAKDNQ